MPRKPSYDRDDLINRAKDLFWRRGWAGTSLKDLEAELQMKPGSFYAAFGSKDALFALALEKYATDGVARVNALAEAHGPLGALQRFPAAVIENEAAPAMACMLSKTLLELQAHKHPLAEKANQYLQRMEAQFAALFEQAQAKGEIASTDDPSLLACKYQSDLLGLRVTAERTGGNAGAVATRIAEGLARL
ncbi:TetR/AcrR family transcriptional regulator [Rhodalgimonas zhirmunskyi]|uniref:TetR/AcrR family transcriptional regulator n=1 Tax=Rhodalgimonas zhirmunskyi TaxID=2964767 RepID=A0AAJ1UA38_9RHOB|nr:TetR/AcrR family transcriptional regulator [Rhodoalgimonas zhirmunskyi]MDQ2094033.1 TetR/AcrR family transcriptional regulator [Rhodoalgimonas zhirmunskyi]